MQANDLFAEVQITSILVLSLRRRTHITDATRQSRPPPSRMRAADNARK